jgi:hypothetical protein
VLATLWALCKARARFHRLGLPRKANMMGLASGRQRKRACVRWKCARVASDERCEFGRAQVVSIASIVGVMEWARTVIVGGIVTAALMKYRTKTATSWT